MNYIKGGLYLKSGHFLAFGVLGILTARGFRFSNNLYLSSKYFLISIIVCIIYGAFDEIHQLWVPGRFASICDWIADALGIVVFIWIYQQKVRSCPKT